MLTYFESPMGLVVSIHTLGKRSNKSPRNFDILVKLKLSGKCLYFKQRYCIIEVISQNIIMIYQFPEFVSQYKDRYPHSVKSEVKKHLNHLSGKHSFHSKSLVCPIITLSIFTVKITFRQVLLSDIVI